MHRVALPTRRRARASSLPHGPLRIEQLETRRVCASSATLLLAGSNAPVYQGVSIVGPGTLLVGNNPPTYQPPPQATPEAAPGQPTAILAASSGGRVTLSWTAPANDGGSPILDYQAQYKRTGESDATYTTIADGQSTATWMTVTGLNVGTSYTFRVLARNAVGVGAASEPSTPRTVRQGPSAAPSTPVSISTTTTNGRVTVSWIAPADDGGMAVHDYWVQYKRSTAMDWHYTTYNEGISAATTATIELLHNRLDYTFRVFAQNRFGISEASEASSVIVASRAAPSAPTALTATSTKGKVNLSWTPPADDGGSPIRDYWVQYKLTGQPDATYTTFRDGESTMTTTTVTNLPSGRSFTFRVLAQNSIGVGAASATTALTVAPRTAPSAPFALTGYGKRGSVDLEWRAPLDDGGESYLHYRVQYKLTGQPDSTYTTSSAYAGNNTRVIIPELAGDTSYTFRVFAQNWTGLSEPSATFTATTNSVIAPGSPQYLGGYSSGGTMSLQWTAPLDDNGTAIYDYWVQYKLAHEADAMYVTFFDGLWGGTTMTVHGLTVGRSYTFRVFAQSRAGLSTASQAWPPTVPIA